MGRGPEPLEFLGALGPAQSVEHRSRLDQVGSVHGRSQPEHEPGPHLVLDREAATPAEELADHREGIIGLLPRAELDPVSQGAQLVAGQRNLEMGQDQGRLHAGTDDEAGQALERRGVVPEQVQVVR